MKTVGCTALNRIVFSALCFLPHPVLLQKCSLFWKGAMTSYCRLCITNFWGCTGSQTSDVSDGPVTWLHVPSNSLFVNVPEIRSSYQEFSSLYMQSALTIALVTLCAIKVPSQEQVMELCVPLCCMLPTAEAGGSFRCGWGARQHLQDALCRGRFAWALAFILKTDIWGVSCSPALIKECAGPSVPPKWW